LPNWAGRRRDRARRDVASAERRGKYAWLLLASLAALGAEPADGYNSGVIFFIGRLWCTVAHQDMHHNYGGKRRVCLRCLQVALG
jgi:hypothetical protein